MNFSEILNHVITLYSNQNKTYTQNEVVSPSNPSNKVKGIDKSDAVEGVVALKQAPEKTAFDEYLVSLDGETIRKLCTVAFYGRGEDENLDYIKSELDTHKKDKVLLELTKNSQYLTRGKKLMEDNNIDIDGI